MKSLAKIYDEICKLIESGTQEQQDRWNFITDIDTNEIRPEGKQEALELWKELCQK